MKKLTALMLAALMLLAIGCTVANDVAPANETQPTAAVEQPTAVPTDEPVSDHDRAMELIQTGDYEAAYALLEQIGEPEAIAANKYDRAQALIETGNYEAAYALLDGLEYKDSEELFGNVKFQLQKNSISIAEEGDYITFGAYEQDNDLSNGKEDIEWLVLAKDEDKLLAISRYILDCGPYNSSEEDVLWRDCSLRTWLNNEFYHAAFDADQQEMIAVSDAKDGNNPFFEDPIEEIYVDHVFLLGPFGFQFEKYFQMSPQRRPQKTAYAKAQGAMEELWWLKSSCSGDEYYYNSLTENDMMYDYFTKEIIGIRPVIWINIEESTVCSH